MWIEAILSRDDLAGVLTQLAPLSIDFGKGSLHISNPRGVILIPEVGLRLVCDAKLHWPLLLGLAIPIPLAEVAIVLKPRIGKAATGDRLVFGIEIEHADLSGIPTIVDDHVTDKLNRELAERHVELGWNFTETLSHSFKLPDSLHPALAIDLTAEWGEIRITSEALVWAIAFRATVTRPAEDDAASNADASRTAAE